MPKRLTTMEFIKAAKQKHDNIYGYSLIEYINNSTKVKIICPIHGMFEQTANAHLQGQGCPICNRMKNKNVILYNTFQPQLFPYGVECRRPSSNRDALEVKCMYCDKWYSPIRSELYRKIRSIKSIKYGEGNLYCSEGCRYSCPTYHQKLYPQRPQTCY